MSYNSISRDKIQAFGVKNVINPIATVVLLLIAFLNVTNIVNQLRTVSEAKRKNAEVKAQILNLTNENLKLKNEIGYATTSAYLSQLAKDKLGLGTKDDYWLVIAEDKLNYDIVPKAKQEEVVPNWKLWFWLFIKQDNMLK